jgi:CheY-like chemotaxis protein
MRSIGYTGLYMPDLEDYILVVDDDDAVREAVVETLEDESYSVRVARNGREALNLLQGGLRPCLVLLDLMMPVMNGWEFAREFGQDPGLAEIPICVITAAGPNMPIPPEAIDVVRKPLELDKLLEVVQRHC